MGGLDRDVGSGDFTDGVVTAEGAVGEGVRVEGVKGEVWRPCFVGIEEETGFFTEASDLPDGVDDTFVGAGGEDEEAGLLGVGLLRGGGESGVEFVQGHGAPDAEASIVVRREVVWDGACHDDSVVDGFVAIAIDEDMLSRTEEGHEHGFVGGGGAVGDVTGLGGAEDLGGETLGLREGGMRFRRGEVAEGIDRGGEVGTEDK